MFSMDPDVVRAALVDVYVSAYKEVMAEKCLEITEEMEKEIEEKLKRHFDDMLDPMIMLTFMLTDDEIRKKAKKDMLFDIDADLQDMLENEMPVNERMI